MACEDGMNGMTDGNKMIGEVYLENVKDMLPPALWGKCMYNIVYFCDSISVNSYISICYDAGWVLFKYKELRKLRNKVIIIVFMFVECFT